MQSQPPKAREAPIIASGTNEEFKKNLEAIMARGKPLRPTMG